MLHKRRHILESTPHSHLAIIPGTVDAVVEEERAITVTIGAGAPTAPRAARRRHGRCRIGGRRMAPRTRAIRQMTSCMVTDACQYCQPVNIPLGIVVPLDRTIGLPGTPLPMRAPLGPIAWQTVGPLPELPQV